MYTYKKIHRQSHLKINTFMKHSIIIAGIILMVLAACKEKKASEPANGLPEDFVQFYEKFHSDSAYQMAHIQFPLPGLPSGVTEENKGDFESFHWQRKDWVLHKPFKNPDNQFERTFDVISEDIIIETIQVKSTDIKMVRRFAKLSGDWFLIYYRNLNF